MNDPGSGQDRPADGRDEHPDVDVLADLAAEVLPQGQAALVERHVHGCAQCADLLAEAESLRRLLLADDPGPMPADVWDRLESALSEEAAWTRRSAAAAASPASPDASDASDASDHDATAPVRPVAGAIPLTRGPRLRRPAAAGGRTRRQVRSEDRSERRSRLPLFLGAAAAAVVLVGGVGFIAQSLLPSVGNGSASDTAAGMAPSSAQAEAGGADVVVKGLTSTGTNYTTAQVADQVRALMSAERAAPPQGTTDTLAGTSTLLDPTGVQQCLEALGAQDVQPVAIDLAQWEGRPAAIVVLPGRTGGYEVWAVARDCRVGADGTLYFGTVAP